MTFAMFTKAVKMFHPEYEVYNHATERRHPYAQTVFRVGVDYGSGKVYSYNGSYTAVLFRLGICTVSAIEAQKSRCAEALDKYNNPDVPPSVFVRPKTEAEKQAYYNRCKSRQWEDYQEALKTLAELEAMNIFNDLEG